MAETKQFPDHLQSLLLPEVDSDDCNSDGANHETTSEIDIDEKATEEELSDQQEEYAPISKQYPPQTSTAQEMSKYIYTNTTIPLALPLSLRSGATSFPKR